MTENLLSNWSLMVAIVAFYFAYFQWESDKRERRSNLIKALQKQLECLGLWVGAEYGKSLTPAQKLDNSDPYKTIYDTASGQLTNLINYESITNIPENIIGEINELYYDLVRINNIQNLRNTMASSLPHIAFSISKKLSSNNSSFNLFYSSLSADEQYYIGIILNLSTNLHCNIIGDKNSGGARTHWGEINHWIELERGLSFDWLFIFFSSFTILICSHILRLIYPCLVNSNIYVLLLIAIDLLGLLSLGSGAISWGSKN